MPWRETDVRNERIRFVVEALKEEDSMSGVCQRFGISRKTGYKWLARYQSVGAGPKRATRAVASPAPESTA